MSETTAPLLATRDALRSALLAVLMDEYGGTERDWTGMGSLGRVVAALPVRDPATVADDLKKFDLRREWGYVQSDAADADAGTILSNVQRFLEAHIDRTLAAALAEDPS